MDFFDLHCDTPYECYKEKQNFYENKLAVSAKKGEMFSNWCQTFAVWIKDDTENPFLVYKNIITDFKLKLNEKPNNLTPYFSVEGGAVLESDADRLYILKNDGISFLTLTWNGENSIAGGVNSNKNLTPFGKKVIDKMNKLKIGCDLSHLNEKSFYSALEYANYPLASHSNCYDFCNHKRNLKESQIKALCQKDGIIGLCFYPEFLNGDVFLKIYENIAYLCDMGYENNIAIGSDFDGAKMSDNLKNIVDIPNLYIFLSEKGLEKELLSKIFYKNAYNFVAKLK